ncbi:potassium channel family protein [Alteromonas gilva]|uniref:Potassium channel family protein n=1 Tax=Alteromonas gilva TaxID=2987522 RepID=A0ABT5L1L3_9ALTE|nr:potassium channel family protein [Alteromonas gilva]MDC8830366.1 potassium channel family protein [Alteromonas gilva]
MWIKIRRVMLNYFAESRWYTIVLVTLFYAASSWLLLFAFNEHALTSSVDFIYWLAVTGSTVGYGDLSPQTPAGKIIVALYVIPLGLSIFAMIVGRVAGFIGNQWRKGLMGLSTLDVNDHILVIGWNEQRTLLLLKLLLQERQSLSRPPDIVLCVRADISNPMPGKIEFVKVESFNKDEDMDKACISSASTILIDNPLDDLTMTTALYCAQKNPSAHQVAYFNDESLVKLLQQHCPQVECTPSVAVEMLAKAAFDPGSSSLTHDLLSVDDEGQAQYSVIFPASLQPMSYQQLFMGFKRHYDATIIGCALASNQRSIKLNPSLDTVIAPEDKLYYIARKRINDVNWSSFTEQ